MDEIRKYIEETKALVDYLKVLRSNVGDALAQVYINMETEDKDNNDLRLGR